MALAAPALAAVYDTASLAAELRRLRQQPDYAAANVPPAWEVQTAQARYLISTEPFRSADREHAKMWLDHLAAQLESSSGPAIPAPRRELQRILARSEFASVGPPSAWEQFRERISAWIYHILDRIFSFVAQHPTGGKLLFWVIVTATILAIGWWLFQFWTREERVLSLPQPVGAARLRTWDEWTKAARDAAEQGDWRKAIQCAYWAGVARLQQTGALPRDMTHTPREYLRLLSAPQPAVEPMATLTSRLERFWYGRQSADAGEFRECLGALEALGCRLD